MKGTFMRVAPKLRLRKKYQLVPQCLFLQTRAGIFDVSTRAGAWLFTALHV